MDTHDTKTKPSEVLEGAVITTDGSSTDGEHRGNNGNNGNVVREGEYEEELFDNKRIRTEREKGVILYSNEHNHKFEVLVDTFKVDSVKNTRRGTDYIYFKKSKDVLAIIMESKKLKIVEFHYKNYNF